MRVKEVMTRELEMVEAMDTLQAAAQKMRVRDVGVLPVLEDGKAIGMITDRDIAIRAVANGKAPDRTKVSEAMTPEIVCLREDQDIHEAAKLMSERRIRRAVVLGSDDQLAGIVSLGDLAVRARGTKRTLSRDVLESVSEPTGAPA